MPKRKIANSPKAKAVAPASTETDADVLAQIRTAEQNGAETWQLIEMAMKHVMRKGAVGADESSASLSGKPAKTSLVLSLKALPPRQRTVLRLLLAGLNYKQIAEELSIAHSTVKVTVARLRKLYGETVVPVLRQKTL